MREELSKYQSDHPCSECNGYRLKPQALAVKVDRKHIGEISAMSIRDANQWFADLLAKLSADLGYDLQAAE